MGAAKEISVNASTAVVLSEHDAIFTSKEELKTALEAEKSLQCCFVFSSFDLLPTVFGKSSGKHRDAKPLATGR